MHVDSYEQLHCVVANLAVYVCVYKCSDCVV